MVITNLEHVENFNAVNEIQGSVSIANLTFENLALGQFTSQTFGQVETLAVTLGNVKLSSLSGSFLSIAV